MKGNPRVADSPNELDSPWKAAIERYLPAFMELLFPGVHAGIDWSRGYVFLDQELQQVVRDAELSRRMADRLVQVWRNDGEEAWVLIHIEIQGQPDPEFALRMFTYHYRIFDRYGRPVVSLAVLGDSRPGWRPAQYEAVLWGCRLRFDFPMVKLLDYEAAWDELAASTNPIALLVRAHLRVLTTRRQPQSRLRWKVRLVREMLRQGGDCEEVLELFRLLDWILVLPPELEQEFDAAMHTLAEEEKMPYISGFERRAAEKAAREALQQGRQLEAVQSVLDILGERFGGVPRPLAERLGGIQSPERLRDLRRRAIGAASLAEFERELPS
jgi:hypothetical protein